jgi:hypothetical protein
MGGIVGRLFHQFAGHQRGDSDIGFVSLSLTPMLCSRFLRPPGEKHGGCSSSPSAALIVSATLTAGAQWRHPPSVPTLMTAVVHSVTVYLYEWSCLSQPGHQPINASTEFSGCILRHTGRLQNRWMTSSPRIKHRRLLLANGRRRQQRWQRGLCRFADPGLSKLTPEQVWTNWAGVNEIQA